MNKLKFLLVALFICALPLQAEESETPEQKVDQSYGYYSIGAGFPSIFTLNVGKKVQHHHHGFEGGIGVTPLIIAIEGHIYANYLYFPYPNLDSQIYVGLGGQAGYGVETIDWRGNIGYFKPQFLLGKEYLTGRSEKRFIQAAIGGGYLTTRGSHFFPSLIVSYGIKF